MLHVHAFTFNAFQENTYVVYTDEGDAVVIDPGCYEEAERQEVDAFIAGKQLHIQQVWLTHCHIDHVLGCYHFRIKHKASVCVPEHEIDVLESVKAYAAPYGFPDYQPVKADSLIRQTDTLVLGPYTFQVRFAPGHSPGHLVFYQPESKLVLGGDVLFNGSIGRFDLPGGDQAVLYQSIREQLYTLPDDTTVYCGHGPTTTVGQEKQTNPFVQG